MVEVAVATTSVEAPGPLMRAQVSTMAMPSSVP